jgi:hypothetical protein
MDCFAALAMTELATKKLLLAEADIIPIIMVNDSSLVTPAEAGIFF